MLRPALFALLCAALTGCGAIDALNSASAPARGFELRLPAEMPRAASASRRHVTVEVPETSGALATDGMLMRTSGVEAAFLPGAQWTDDLPLMVQTLLLRGLAASEGYAFVGREPLGLSGDYAILTELVDFQGAASRPAAEGDSPHVTAQVGLQIRVIRESDARVIGNRRFSREVPAAGDDAAQLAEALDQAMAALLPEITAWIMGRTGLRAAR